MTAAPHPRSALVLRYLPAGAVTTTMSPATRTAGADRQHGTRSKPRRQENEQAAAMTNTRQQCKGPATGDHWLDHRPEEYQQSKRHHDIPVTRSGPDIRPEWDNLRAALEHPDQPCRHKYSAFRAPRPSMTSRRSHPPWLCPTGRGVTAAVLTELMLTILSLAGEIQHAMAALTIGGRPYMLIASVA